MPGPERIANVLAELMARRGYGRVQSTAAYEDAWRQAAGPLLAQHTRVGLLRRGTLEVVVSNSILMQEMTFQKATLVRKLAELLPEEGLRNLRFKMGPVA